MKAALILVLVLITGPAAAADVVKNGIKIEHPWSRSAALGGVGAGFGDIANVGKGPVTLISITTTGAGAAMLHKTNEASGVFSMTQTSGLVIPEGGTVTFAPGSYHIMFTGLKAKLRPGSELPARFTFSRSGKLFTVDVKFEVNDGPIPAPPSKWR